MHEMRLLCSIVGMVDVMCSWHLSHSLSSQFFFNYSASTEFYPYGHTLSLHAALPICIRPCSRRYWSRRQHRGPNASQNRNRRAPGSNRNPRSEEHTSALQSLMRISYAVFCLIKKLITITIISEATVDNNHNVHRRIDDHQQHKQHYIFI